MKRISAELLITVSLLSSQGEMKACLPLWTRSLLIRRLRSLANEHEVTSAPPTGSMLRPCKSLMKQGPLGKELADNIDALEATVAQLNATGDSRPNCSPAGTDLGIDWADACSLGRNGERYFLLVVDKDTDYLANFNTKSRHNPVDLLRAYVIRT